MDVTRSLRDMAWSFLVVWMFYVAWFLKFGNSIIAAVPAVGGQLDGVDNIVFILLLLFDETGRA